MQPVTPRISWDDVIRDKRARVYHVDMKRRRPNRYSVTSRIILSTVAAFALQVWRPSITQAGLKLSDKILRGEQLYRLVTPVFLHGGIFHIFFNMSSLANSGRDVEALFGPGRFLGTYLAAGVAGNLLSAMQSPNPALGASGAVFGVFGAYFTFLTRNKWLLGANGEAITNSITQTMLFNLLYGAASPQIDNWGHLGGLIGGAAVAYWTGPRLYLCKDAPTGGSSLVIDRPFLRAPQYVEKVATQCGRSIDMISQAVRNGIPGASGSRPWQSASNAARSRRREFAVNQSLKPKSGGVGDD